MDRPCLFSIDIAERALPRTMTRAQWRAVDHWRRTVARKVEQAMAPHIVDAMHELVTHGHCELRVEPSPFSIQNLHDAFVGRRKP